MKAVHQTQVAFLFVHITASPVHNFWFYEAYSLLSQQLVIVPLFVLDAFASYGSHSPEAIASACSFELDV